VPQHAESQQAIILAWFMNHREAGRRLMPPSALADPVKAAKVGLRASCGPSCS
jgi:hypothetical protein